MTASKPKTASQFVSNNDSLRRTQNNTMTKRPRGPINKRACQRCRSGKIKCDGDAEHNKSCSNCDPESCIFDTSPRKNKQVEHLKQRLGHLEEQLESIVQGVNDQLTIQELKIEILSLLIDLKELFDGSENVFRELKKLTMQGNCVQQLLIFIRELLQRISKEQDRIHEIIDSLRKVILCAEEVNKDPSSLSQLQAMPLNIVKM
ncbi:6725_t:CDS:2 [Diversispora eburnea]|uniref:6725_t:CDS:1 n=2 Tax=Diversisporales TaxID=214509 RepID=A0A9N8VBI1_9GLOM|nr:6725_t:CDS:2 [Diversispora eburnea]